jgi:hypothetical protein
MCIGSKTSVATTRRSALLRLVGGVIALGAPSTYAYARHRLQGCVRKGSRHAVVAPCHAPSGQGFPDLMRWNRITKGMRESDVESLLGEPLNKRALQNVASSTPEHAILPVWNYGKLPLISGALPADYEFLVVFREGSISRKIDPFGGKSSSTGIPSSPKLISPGNGATFDHYPPVVDLRWYPAAGIYPIWYLVQIEIGNTYPVAQPDGSERVGWRFDETPAIAEQADIPYLCAALPGIQRYRWRVKAFSRLGESDWSAYREFEFC